jgi:hypothetical protein
MRLCGQRLCLIACVLIALVSVLMLRSAEATGAKPEHQTCTWGASSITAQTVDGKVVVSQPAISGCVP